MFIWFKSHPIWTTFTLGASFVVATNIFWAAFKYVRERISASNGEVLDILIFNELSSKCADRHRQNASFKCNSKYCSTRHLQRLVHQIDQAQYCIDIAMYTFTLYELMEALERALARGVQLRVISDAEMFCSSGSQVVKLHRAGVMVRAPKTTCMMHHKFLVIDGRARADEIMRNRKLKPHSVVVYGSVNWTLQGFNGNWENCVISSSKEISSKFEAEFNRMWISFENSKANLRQSSS